MLLNSLLLSPAVLVLVVIYYIIFLAVILPTLNDYLLSLGAQSYFIGLVMASFSLTGLLSAPIYGRITDVTHSTKWVVSVSNLFEIIGELSFLHEFLRKFLKDYLLLIIPNLYM